MAELLRGRNRVSQAERDALEAVRKQNADGLLVSREVVEAAADEENPLHRRFDWDDSAAAQKFREAQARQLIRLCEVTMPEAQGRTLPQYVSLRSDRNKPGGGYRETREVMRSKELLTELEATAKKELDAVLARFEMLRDFVERVRGAAGIPSKKKK